MSRIDRKHQKVFAGGASNNGQFGSAQAGTKITSNDLDTLQALAAWSAGWNSATISGERLPTLEEMQALHYITTTQLAYLFQEGVAEYNADTEYHENSVVKKSGTYELYGSLTNNNTGNALPSQTDNANWQYLGDLAQLINAGEDVFSSSYLHIQEQQPSGTGGGATVGGTTQTRVLNTVVTNEISGASLASNQITLPAGSYYIKARAPVFVVGNTSDTRHKAKLYDTTGSSDLIIGSAECAGGDSSTDSVIFGRFTLAAESDLEIRHYTENSRSFGAATSSGDIEIYTEVEIWRIS